MPIFEKPPLETLTPAKDRWTPIYLEHGRLEVDDSSIKWIGADRLVYRLPVATLSAVLLGPGTSVTHAAIVACANSNTPVCWIAEDGMRFYAFGITPNHDNDMPRRHATAWGTRRNGPISPAACFLADSLVLMCTRAPSMNCAAWRAFGCERNMLNSASNTVSLGKDVTMTSPIGTGPTTSIAPSQPPTQASMPCAPPCFVRWAICPL